MRLSRDEYFMNIAIESARRATCSRRAVGSVAVDKNNYIISTGYNGVPKDAQHCIDESCIGAKEKSGEGLDLCSAIHAEQNLIAHCSNPKEIHTIYLTVSPCMSCMKLILATSCRRIVTNEIYNYGAINFFTKNGGKVTVN